MVLPDCLFDPASPVVIDASVVINLNATGCAAQIFAAIPNRIVVTDIVANELETGRAKGRTDADQLAMLVASSHVQRFPLSPAAESHFLNFVVGDGIATLDDGEAATIAWALAEGGIPIIDDKKAVGLCRLHFPTAVVGSTVGLLAQPSIAKHLGVEMLAESIYLALTMARMRVPDEWMSWVVGVIGPARAPDCHSLPERVRNATIADVSA